MNEKLEKYRKAGIIKGYGGNSDGYTAENQDGDILERDTQSLLALAVEAYWVPAEQLRD